MPAVPRRRRSGQRCVTRGEQLAGPARAAFVFPRMFGEALTPPMAADLVGIARDWEPDLLVHEQAELAAPLVGGRSCGAERHPLLRDRRAGWRPSTSRPSCWPGCGRRTASRCRRTPAATGPAISTSVRPRCRPCRSTTSEVQPLRPVRTPARCRQPAEPLVYVTLGTVAAAPGAAARRRGRRGWAAGPRAGGARTPDRSRTRSGSSPGTCRWSRGSTRPRCWAAALPWSRTVARAPSWVRWLGACPSSACRRPRTSSATPRAVSRAGASLTLAPAEVSRRQSGPRSSGCCRTPTSGWEHSGWPPRSRRCPPPRPWCPSSWHASIIMGLTRTTHATADDGTRLAVHVHGSGTPLLCLPGGPMLDSGYFRDLGGLDAHRAFAPPRPARDRRVGRAGRPRVVPLRPAGRRRRGGTPPPRPRADRPARPLRRRRPRLRTTPAAHPDRVARLVLVAPSARGLDIEITDEARSKIARLRQGEPWYAEAEAALVRIQAGTGDERGLGGHLAVHVRPLGRRGPRLTRPGWTSAATTRRRWRSARTVP